jgi:hypothetical protein
MEVSTLTMVPKKLILKRRDDLGVKRKQRDTKVHGIQALKDGGLVTCSTQEVLNSPK